jgi:archaemetzincin
VRLPPVRLVPVGPPHPDTELVAWLAGELRHRFGAHVTLAPPLTIPPDWRADPPSRVPSSPIVDALVVRFPPPGWTLGLAAADLFADGRDFVFGEATHGGFWAVVSTARLLSAPPDEPLLRARLFREVLHEFGHLAGLDHCGNPSCVMAFAASAGDVDRKNPEFCAGCAARLTRALRP